MQIGIFAKTFERATLEAVFDAIQNHGLSYVHFDMACVGPESMPERIDPELCDRIRQGMAARNLTMASVSGTFNMSHPDPAERRRGLQRTQRLRGRKQHRRRRSQHGAVP